MNILFANTTPFHPYRGGVERVADTLCRELQRRGHNVIYLHSRWVDEERRMFRYPAPVEMLPDEDLGEKDREYYQMTLRRLQIDVVVNHESLYVDFFNQVGDVPVKVVSVVHSNPLLNYNHLWSDLLTLRNGSGVEKMKRVARCLLYPKIKRRLRKFIFQRFRNISSASDKVVMLSHHYLDSLRNLGVPVDGKYDFIYNPNSYPRQELFPAKQNEILFVGRLHNQSKKVNRLLNVWARIWKAYPDWRLTIVGDGQDRDQLVEMAGRLKLGNLSFEGSQTPVEYYRRAAIVCMTSSFEGFPMVLVEAMQFGCVTIAYDSFEAVRDVIIPGKTGMLVEPFSIRGYVGKLRQLMDNETLRERMAYAALDHVARFDVKPVVDKWEDLLKGL